ncbi:MAG: sensor histidine kinase [Bacteroidales bacterium]|nr:sensor histidine kinase [Bacteroidales bacterium]
MKQVHLQTFSTFMKLEFLRKTWLSHALIWGSYFILLVWLYSETRNLEPTLVKSLFVVLVQAGIFYLNLFILLPQYFEKKKYTRYGLLVFMILITSLALFFLFDQLSFQYEYKQAVSNDDFSRFGNMNRPRHFGPRGWGYPFHFQFIWRQAMFNGFFVVIVLFISTIYRNIKLSGRKEKEALELKSRVTEAESNMLKSQINPHFLFNTLNNIYSMAQLKSENTAEAVHRLSEMLRYVIYDCNEKYVNLEQEISYLQSYIELQLMKEENMDNVQYDFNKVNGQLRIAPLLLIPFVENSFKHSRFDDMQHSWIKIIMETSGKQLIFNIENSIPDKQHQKDNTQGIGLENVRKRLHLIYPDKHYIKLMQVEKIFKVELILELDAN